MTMKRSREFYLGKYISMLYRYGRTFFEHKLVDYDIGSGQHTFLFFLYYHNGASQDEVSKALDIDKTTTTRAIQKLEKLELLYRKKDDLDQRINRVFLTEKGFATKGELISFSKEWEEILLSGFSVEEKQQLNHLILKLTDNARAYKDFMNK